MLKQGLQPGEENHRSSSLKDEASNKQEAVADRGQTLHRLLHLLSGEVGEPLSPTRNKHLLKTPKVKQSEQAVGRTSLFNSW